MSLNVPASGPTATIAFNGTTPAIASVTMGSQFGTAFIKLDLTQTSGTVQVRVLPDLFITTIGSTEFLQNETLYNVKIYREVEPGQFLLDTPFGSRYFDDPYLGARDPDSIQEADITVAPSTRDPHSLLLAKGAFYIVIEGQAQPFLPTPFLSGRLAIEVTGDLSGPLPGGDPRPQLWGANWLQNAGEFTPAPPQTPQGSGGSQPTPGAPQIGGPGADQLIGGAGNETLDGAGGQDFIRGGDGNDVISGGIDFDDTHGNMGNDTVSGGAGDDWVVGGKGDDLLFGDDGADIVLGNLGADTCDGGAGADIVRGGQDNDIVRGGAGNDYVSGDRGADTVTGGTGADAFHSFGDAGLDRVTDFNRGEGDFVRLDPGTQYTVAQSGADVVISMVGGGQLVLAGVSLSSLTSGWVVVG